MTQVNLTTDTLRRLALMQHLGEEFFIIGDTAFCGNAKETRAEFEDKGGDLYDQSFKDYCLENCIEVEELEADDYSIDYLVLTDEEADEKAGEYIKDSLWAFTPNFLSEQTGLDPEIFEAIQDNGKCESNNDTIYNTIQKLGDIDTFISDAVSTDGRGHFLSSYDGYENEETVEGESFYIYRIN